MGKENSNKGLIDLINTFNKKHILVIGDTIVDKTTYLKAIGLSLESPTLKTEFTKEETTFGGAANVVKTIVNLGGKCYFITNDLFDEAHSNFKYSNLDLFCGGKLPVKKHRFWVEHGGSSYKHLQINYNPQNNEKYNNKRYIEETFFCGINNDLNVDWEDFSAIVFCDYKAEFITKSLREEIYTEAKRCKIPIFISSQSSTTPSNFQDYVGADYFVMNIKEANEFLGTNYNFTSSYPDYKSWKSLNAKGIYITRGENGSCFLDLEKEACFSCPNIANLFPNLKIDKNSNIIGAGDCFLGTIVLGKDNPILGQKLANIVAGKFVQNNKLGDVPCSEDLLKFLKEENHT